MRYIIGILLLCISSLSASANFLYGIDFALTKEEQEELKYYDDYHADEQDSLLLRLIDTKEKLEKNEDYILSVIFNDSLSRDPLLNLDLMVALRNQKIKFYGASYDKDYRDAYYIAYIALYKENDLETAYYFSKLSVDLYLRLGRHDKELLGYYMNFLQSECYTYYMRDSWPGIEFSGLDKEIDTAYSLYHEINMANDAGMDEFDRLNFLDSYRDCLDKTENFYREYDICLELLEQIRMLSDKAYAYEYLYGIFDVVRSLRFHGKNAMAIDMCEIVRNNCINFLIDIPDTCQTYHKLAEIRQKSQIEKGLCLLEKKHLSSTRTIITELDKAKKSNQIYNYYDFYYLKCKYAELSNKLDSATYYAEKQFDCSEGDSFYQAWAMYNLARLAKKQGKYEKANIYLSQIKMLHFDFNTPLSRKVFNCAYIDSNIALYKKTHKRRFLDDCIDYLKKFPNISSYRTYLSEYYPEDSILADSLFKVATNVRHDKPIDSLRRYEIDKECFARIMSQSHTIGNKHYDTPLHYDFHEKEKVTYAYDKPDSLYNILAYNFLLVAKNMLLQSKSDLYKAIKKYGIAYDVETLDYIQKNKDIIREIESGKIKVGEDSLKTLLERVNYEECYLLYWSYAYKHYLQTLNTTWEDVQASLNDDDIAIEFYKVPYKKDYIVLTIRKDYVCPKINVLENLEILCKEKNDSILYDAIWETLRSQIDDDIKNVYFSPDGALNGINIEALPEIVKGDRTRNYYRLSSTRLLAHRKENSKHGNGGLLFGGLDYNMDADELIADQQSYADSNNKNIWNIFRGDRGDRYGAVPLPYSCIEVDNIHNIMNKAGIRNALFKGKKGTETAFKSQSGKNYKYIHIATHGFCNISGTEETDNSNILSMSGLKMAGCNAKLDEENIPQDVDDGIMASKEIEDLDLSGVDIISLSACDTGLGYVNSEGVFGLQRAFKEAGVNTLLMTLSKVDDKASELLFTKFYENLLVKKMSKVQALRNAQHYLQNYKEKFHGKIQTPYADPSYWSPFILLDALE